tara:strand:- start:1081 stop:1314 length:234 start_codon:yes stop_codon:yes gene_type:complete
LTEENINYDLLRKLFNKLEIKEFKEKDSFSQVMTLLMQFGNLIESNTYILKANREHILKLQKNINTLENKIKELEEK